MDIQERIDAARETMATIEAEDRQLEQQAQSIAQRRNTLALEHVKLQGRLEALSEMAEQPAPLALVPESETGS